MINQYKIKINTFSAEINEPVDPKLRSLITMEVDFYEESLRDLQNGEYDKVFKGKLCGSCIVKQGTKKPILAKSKRSPSQKLRQAIFNLNPDEQYYEIVISKIVSNVEEIVEFLKDK